MSDQTSTILSGSYVRSGSGTLSDRYNNKTYAIRGRNASKVANARPDMQLLSTLPENGDGLESDSLTGRADWDLLLSRDGLYTPEGRRTLPRGFRISPTVKRKKAQQAETKRRLTSLDDITVDDLFGSDE